MNSLGRIFLVALLVSLSTAEYTEIIRERCQGSFAIIAHPSPLMCDSFVVCVFFNGIVSQCDLGFIFVAGEGCVSGDRETCEREFPTPTMPTFPTDDTTLPIWTTSPPIDINSTCNGIQMDIIADPRFCTQFILCLFEEPIVVPCPESTPVFYPPFGACVSGDPATCQIGGTTLDTTAGTTQAPGTVPPPTLPPTTQNPGTDPPPTLPPTTQNPGTNPPPTLPADTTQNPGTNPPPTLPNTSTTQSPPPPFVCLNNNFRFVADPFTCFRYYYCFFGYPLPGECDPDRIFVERLQGCLMGNQVTCERDRIINVPNIPLRQN